MPEFMKNTMGASEEKEVNKDSEKLQAGVDGAFNNVNMKVHRTNHSEGKSVADKKLFKIGIVVIITAFIIICLPFRAQPYNSTNGVDATEILNTGTSKLINRGTILSDEQIYKESKDYTIQAEESYGELTMSIWDYNKEDGDFVTVIVDGEPVTESFLLRNEPIDIKIPKDANIKVVGVKDGNKQGISYAVYFSQNQQTYLNIVAVGGENTYQVVGN